MLMQCRSPRDQSYGLDGRSEVSRDLSTTHALSRTLSFLSCGVSENISPTAAHSHTSTFVTHASGQADELLSTRTGPEPAVSTGVPGLPRTRIAGLPLFLHADVAAVPKALPGVPSAATLRGRLGAEPIPDPLPKQVSYPLAIHSICQLDRPRSATLALRILPRDDVLTAITMHPMTVTLGYAGVRYPCIWNGCWMLL